jgi:hypothetical protein
MSLRLACRAILLAIFLLALIVGLLMLAQSGSSGERLCVPGLAHLSRLMDFHTWLGCALAAHEGLAGGLIGSAGALFAAWIAWHAVMRQINAESDQAYEALREEVERVADTLNSYWRIVDASIRNKQWRRNGIVLLRTLHPPVQDLHREISLNLAKRLDPMRRRHFRDVIRSLNWIAEHVAKSPDDDPLWLENLRTMLSHFNKYLRTFDSAAARRFRWRKKSRLDHRPMAEHLEPLVAKFERDGNM